MGRKTTATGGKKGGVPNTHIARFFIFLCCVPRFVLCVSIRNTKINSEGRKKERRRRQRMQQNGDRADHFIRFVLFLVVSY